MFNQGEQWKFGEKLDADYGKGTCFDLHKLALTTVKMSRVDYEQEIRYYKGIVNNLKNDLMIM